MAEMVSPMISTKAPSTYTRNKFSIKLAS